MLEKKENVLLGKVSAEVDKAKEFSKAKNKKEEKDVGTAGRATWKFPIANSRIRVGFQMILIEGAKATTDTVDALRTGAAAMKAMQKATNIGDVDKTMDEINEQTETMKEIQNALANPIGGFDFDEDELEAELEELEELELEEQILDTETTYPVPPVHVPQVNQPNHRPLIKNSNEEDELVALEKEMTI
ncbi:hypothetical protein C5167_018480 [Papaver somniferum]|uniref:Uncharacterized protein n=1 Tax=Papaver somniferum TaxID=3469 RepID=A0A4Y7IMD5_PAPSO|nr:hypothetical protein C5167_018480 [Papaver somniferum]